MKEYTIGVEVLGRPESFDPRVDSIVRVEASRLRAKLNKHYQTEGRNDSVWIECHAGSYIPVFLQRKLPRTPLPEPIAAARFGPFQVQHPARRMRPLVGERNLSAHQLYLRGRYFLNMQNEAGLEKSTGLFARAIALDSASAPAYAGLAESYCMCGCYGHASPRKVMPKAKAAATRALELDAKCAEAHYSLGMIRAAYEWDWSSAKEDFEQSIELDPNNPFAHLTYATWFLAPQGRLAAALATLRRAEALDPLGMRIKSSLALTLYMMGDFKGAANQARQTIALDPMNGPAHLFLGLADMHQSRYEEAAAAFMKVKNLSEGGPFLIGALGQYYGAVGLRDKAQSVLAQLFELSKERYVSPLDIARVYIGSREFDRAFEWLSKALRERCSRLIWLKVHPMFAPLRSDPRFSLLLSKTGLG